MKIKIRQLSESDITVFPEEFKKQGWHRTAEQFQRYYHEQNTGIRKVFVAEADGNAAGYATLLSHDTAGPFKDQNIPVIVDFNVLEKYQRNGIGTAIMDAIESHVREYSSVICLGVGLHRGYGPAQRMYVKRGYIPDGSGVWFQGKCWGQYEPCVNDDELILYLSKQLTT